MENQPLRLWLVYEQGKVFTFHFFLVIVLCLFMLCYVCLKFARSQSLLHVRIVQYARLWCVVQLFHKCACSDNPTMTSLGNVSLWDYCHVCSLLLTETPPCRLKPTSASLCRWCWVRINAEAKESWELTSYCRLNEIELSAHLWTDSWHPDSCG